MLQFNDEEYMRFLANFIDQRILMIRVVDDLGGGGIVVQVEDGSAFKVSTNCCEPVYAEPHPGRYADQERMDFQVGTNATE